MASASFRESMNSLGWSRREQPAPVTPNNASSGSTGGFLSSLRGYNLFSGGGYVQLPSQESGTPPVQDGEGLFSLSRWDRMLIFAGMNIGALVCFALCVALIFMPLTFIFPRKFVTLWTLGSFLFITSWAFLMGVLPYIKHLLSGTRLPFTAAYFGSIALTLYSSIKLHSTILTLIAAVFQLVALLWYLVSYFPMGTTGLRYAGRFAGGRVAAWMN